MEQLLKAASERWGQAVAERLRADLETSADGIGKVESYVLDFDEEPVHVTTHLRQLAQEHEALPRRS